MTTKQHKKNATGLSSRREKPEKNENPSIILSQENLWRPLYPFESHYMRIGGLAYHYLDEGPVKKEEPEKENSDQGSRPVLLMVHGNPTWSFYWRNLILAFRERYRVIAVDHIGCGLSEKPTEQEYPFTLEARIQNLSHLIRKLNLNQIVLIAHDWGGAIGMGAAVRNPKRFSRFVLMNTGAFRSTLCPLRIRVCRTPWLGRVMLQGFNAFSLAALRMATARHEGLSSNVAAGLIAPYDTWAHRTAVYQFVQDIPLSERHRSWKTLRDVEKGLAGFREHPISLIWGMKDWCFNQEFLKRFLQFFPEADVHRLEKAGHYLVEDSPSEICNLIGGFLEKRL